MINGIPFADDVVFVTSSPERFLTISQSCSFLNEFEWTIGIWMRLIFSK
jgi:hypothetical protein